MLLCLVPLLQQIHCRVQRGLLKQGWGDTQWLEQGPSSDLTWLQTGAAPPSTGTPDLQRRGQGQNQSLAVLHSATDHLSSRAFRQAVLAKGVVAGTPGTSPVATIF